MTYTHTDDEDLPYYVGDQVRRIGGHRVCLVTGVVTNGPRRGYLYLDGGTTNGLGPVDPTWYVPASSEGLGPIHIRAAGPRGLTMCRVSARDVPTVPCPDTATCVACLRAEMDRLGRYRTAWQSARHGRAEWRREAELRPTSTVHECCERVQHMDSAPLDSADMVEPGDEVPDLAELSGVVHHLRDRLDDVDQRIGAVESGLTREGQTTAAPVVTLPEGQLNEAADLLARLGDLEDRGRRAWGDR